MIENLFSLLSSTLALSARKDSGRENDVFAAAERILAWKGFSQPVLPKFREVIHFSAFARIGSSKKIFCSDIQE